MGLVVAAAVWVVCELLMLLFDRPNSWIGPSTAVYTLLLWAIVAALVPKDAGAEEQLLKPLVRGPLLWMRCAVVALTTIAIIGVYTFVAHGKINVPWVRYAYHALSQAVFRNPGDSGPFNFGLYVVIPLALLFALRTRPRELGLVPWAGRTWPSVVPCLLLPLIMIAIGFAKGSLTLGMLGYWVFHNLLSNGFSEEFFARGMVFSHLRAFLRKDWALFAQAMVFSLLHYAATSEEHGNVIMTLANIISENSVMAIVMGLIALRTRSLALPAILHTSFDTMQRLIGM